MNVYWWASSRRSLQTLENNRKIELTEREEYNATEADLVIKHCFLNTGYY